MCVKKDDNEDVTEGQTTKLDRAEGAAGVRGYGGETSKRRGGGGNLSRHRVCQRLLRADDGHTATGETRVLPHDPTQAEMHNVSAAGHLILRVRVSVPFDCIRGSGLGAAVCQPVQSRLARA